MTPAGDVPVAPTSPRRADRAGRARAVLLLLAVFACGLVTGGVLTLLLLRRALWNPPAGGFAQRRILAELDRELDLDRGQKARVEAIVRETRAELVAVADRAEPEVRASLVKARDRIRAELRPEQRERFDREAARRFERLERLRRRLRGAG